MASSRGRNVMTTTASINTKHLCSSDCVQCGSHLHNQGIITEDKVHRICKHCFKQTKDCRCQSCGQNIFLKKTEKSTGRPHCFSQATSGICEVCKKFSMPRMLVNFNICNHKMCLRCISYKIHKACESHQDLFQCQCRKKYYVDDIVHFMSLKCEEHKYIVVDEEPYCSCCKHLSQERAIRLSCSHTICTRCMRRMEQSERIGVLPVRRKLTKVLFCPDAGCQIWLAIDEVHKIIQKENEREKQMIDYILNSPNLKSTDKKNKCDCCDNLKRQAVIELGCNHKVCHPTLRYMVDSAVKRQVVTGGNIYNLIKCGVRQCGKYEWEERLTGWIITNASNMKLTNKEDYCDCCSTWKNQAIIQLNCHHQLCRATVRRMLISQYRWSVKNDGKTFYLKICNVKDCEGRVCEEKLKELTLFSASNIKSTKREDKCDCCILCKEESKKRKQLEEKVLEESKKQKQLEEMVLRSSNFRLTNKDDKCDCCAWPKRKAITGLACNHKLCRWTLLEMAESPSKILKEKDGEKLHFMKCMVGSCEQHVCEEKFKEWIYNEEITLLGKFITNSSSSICDECRTKDALALGSHHCGHSFCTDCLQNMLKEYTTGVLIFNRFEVCLCPWCRETVPTTSIENFLAEIQFTGVTSGAKNSKSSTNVLVSKFSQKAPSYPSTHEETMDKWEPESRETKGIWNIGLTCYGNCILQVLAQTPNFLEKLEYAVTTMTKNKDVFNNLCEVLHDINKSTIGLRVVDYEKTYCLWHDISSMNPDLDPYRQNDSYSFTLSLFSLIDEHCSTEKGPGPISSFEGELLNEFKFSACKHTDESVQIFRSLTIPVFASESKQRACTIENGIEILMREETFENNLVPCKECDGHQTTRTTKRLKLSRLPQILLLQIGRVTEWSYSESGTTSLYKLSLPVSYKKELPGTVFATTGDVDPQVKYSLYAVVMHYGSLRSGHYYSYVKNIVSKAWFCCNDSRVMRVDGPPETCKDAYLLFYEKC